jgi:hypothetical protein
MHQLIKFFSGATLAALSLLLLSLPAAAAVENGCKSYLALRPLPRGVLDLLGTVPSSQSPFVSPALRQLRDWNFPGKVTPWHGRPDAQQIQKARQDAMKEVSRGGPVPAAKPYQLQPAAAGDWSALEKWFAKDGPKKLPGMCVDQEKPGYVLAVGVISQPVGDTALANAAAREQYNQSVIPQDSSIGQNAATVTPGGENRPADQLAGLSGSDSSGGYTCAYLYRSAAPGGAPQPTPELYYCHSGSGMPKSVITTVLKYVAKQGLP